jgi:hypothetical protein
MRPAAALSPGLSGGLNGSTQHLLEVYSQESESLRFFSGVDLIRHLPGNRETSFDDAMLCAKLNRLSSVSMKSYTGVSHAE